MKNKEKINVVELENNTPNKQNTNSRIVMESNEEQKSLKNSTAKLERERKNYADYLYQNTTEWNIEEFKKRESLKDKEEFLQDALIANEEQKLSNADAFDRYQLVADRVAEHYVTLDETNSALTVEDLAVQTHLILLPEKFVDPTKIKEIISHNLKRMWEKVTGGKVVLIDEKLLFDSLKFENKIVPICVINPKLIPAKYIIDFVELGSTSEMEVLQGFAKILSNALNSRFYVKLDDEIIVLRKGKEGEEQNQLFASKWTLNTNFSNISERERSKEIYDEVNLEEVVSNKTSAIISFDKSKTKSFNGKKQESGSEDEIVKLSEKQIEDSTSTREEKILREAEENFEKTADEELVAKTTTKKPAAKKTTTKKPAAKKTTTKKPAAKKTTTKKPAAKKTTTKKVAKK